jgi:hypothetical protein
MQKRTTELVIALIINVVAGIVTFFFLQDLWMTGLILLVTVLSTVVVLLFLRVEEISQAVNDLRENPPFQPPPCCGLHLAGFSQVFEQASESLNLTIEGVPSNYREYGGPYTTACFPQG